MTVFWSLGYFREQGHKITAYCEQHGPEPMCRHSAAIDLDKAIERFGPDFIVPNEYPRFIASLKCTKCGSRQISIQIGNPVIEHVTPAQPVWLKGVTIGLPNTGSAEHADLKPDQRASQSSRPLAE